MKNAVIAILAILTISNFGLDYYRYSNIEKTGSGLNTVTEQIDILKTKQTTIIKVLEINSELIQNLYK